jgi:predicted AlkP superfamily phosphohydrolase/phosphomutase
MQTLSSNPLRPKRVMIIGLDGATWRVLRPWIDEGKLPTLANLVKRGTYGALQSVIPPVSPAAWTSFATGQLPGKHGVFDWYVRKPGSYEFSYVQSATRRCKAIWELVSALGKRVCVFDLFTTYPAERLNGAMVSGRMSSHLDQHAFYPSGLFSEFRELFGNPNLRQTFSSNYWNNVPGYIRELRRIVQTRLAMALHLLSKEHWDLSIFVFTNTDTIQHALWQYIDRTNPQYDDRYQSEVIDFYRDVDTAVGQLIREAPPDTAVMVMSDHGFGPKLGHFHVGAWLESKGLLVIKPFPREFVQRALTTLVERILRRECPKRIGDIIERSTAIFEKVAPEKLQKLVADYLRKQALRLGVQYLPSYDWSSTKVFPGTSGLGQLFFNTAGRDPNGIVRPGSEFEALGDFLSQELKKLVNADTGEHPTIRVYHAAELFSGPAIDSAPDVQLRIDDFHQYYVNAGTSPSGPGRYVEAAPSGSRYERLTSNHALEGILIGAGPGIRSGHELREAKIIDVAPTALYLMGIPVPTAMDGRILSEMIEPTLLDSFAPTYVDEELCRVEATDETQPYTHDEMREIEEHLRSLGYL